ncbi:MAG: putative O-acetyltransferase [Sphingomonas bacterium]|uniref:acyltransferase family protein n=1 Tax=Sphingomonas bacterium TaxID=1895847 RepID=UPI0026387959|nr:acyltransferase family protein [Sphingomonas bacterium]MDB5710971.1 putative O-acetyltransferase [Sphingomonas bacterium]
MDIATGHLNKLTITEEAPASRYRRDIDGLRAIAVASVVLFHTGLASVGGGFVGVDVFFVISGFLIGGIVHREICSRAFSFAEFYARRARRILPALIAVAAATLAFGLVLLGPDEMRRLSASMAAALTGVSNVWFWATAGYFSPDARGEPFLMTWSLGIEEQFYLFLPPLLLLLNRIGGRVTLPVIAAITLLSLALSVVFTTSFPGEAFYLLPTRAWELGIGVLLALALAPAAGARPIPRVAQEWLGAAGLAAVAAAIILFDHRLPYPGMAALLPTLGAAALIMAEQSVVNRRLLAATPLVWIGLISYSWYLWHWPLLAFVRICAAGSPSITLMTGVALFSLVPAWLSWHFVERPFRHAGRHVTAARQLGRYGAAMAAGVAALLLIYVSHGLAVRLDPAAIAIEKTLDDSRGGACLAPYGADRPNLSSTCVTPDGRPRLALLGDSHAAALGEALRADAARHGLGFAQLTKSSCPPLLGASRAMPNHPGHVRECTRYNQAAIETVAQDPLVRTVVLSGFWQVPFGASAVAAGDAYVKAGGKVSGRSSEDELRLALARTIRRLMAAGKRVVVLSDVPYLRFNPARHAMAPFLPARRAAEALLSPDFQPIGGQIDRQFVEPTDDTGARVVQQAVGDVRGATFVSLSQILCTPSLCRFAEGTTPFYIDPEHLSRPGADHVVAALAGELWP